MTAAVKKRPRPKSPEIDDLPDGRFRLPDDGSPRWPVFGVSYDDASAYAAWCTDQARAAGRPDVYALPTAVQWRVAAGTVSTREFPFGNVFRSWWTKSCFSRPVAAPEPVLGFPVDESVFGVFDTAGSVAEWCADWYIQRGYRTLPSRPRDGLKATVFEGAGRVLRGGDFTTPPADIDARRRVPSRSGAHPTAGVRPALAATR